MPHIHTKSGQHDLTASALIFRTDTPEPRLYLHMHKRVGVLLHFGGHVELDENPWQTIVHEIKEEAGYDIGQLKLLQPKKRLKKVTVGKLVPYPVAVLSVGYYGDHVKEHFHDDLCFAFVTNQKPKYKTSKGESEDLRLMSREEIAKADSKLLPSHMKELAEFAFDECLPNWDRLAADKVT